jgi:sulfide dehydrogenase cytochrome subunit
MNYPGWVVAALFIACAVPAFAQDSGSANVDELIAECEACHGPGGVSEESDIPSLAGMSQEDIVAAIEAFYYYERHCTTTTYRSGDRPKTPMNMCNEANTLSTAQREQIAAYFSGQGD